MVSRWYLGDSHTRANWDRTESSRWCHALSIFIYSLVCQGGWLVSFYFLSQEVENGLNKAERLIGILALVRGSTLPKPLWWCTCLTPCHNLGFYFLDEEGVSRLCSTLEMSTADSLVGLWGVLVSPAFLFESLVAQPRRGSNPHHCAFRWQRNGHTGKPETAALNFWMGWAKRTVTCLWGHGLCCCSLSLSPFLPPSSTGQHSSCRWSWLSWNCRATFPVVLATSCSIFRLMTALLQDYWHTEDFAIWMPQFMPGASAVINMFSWFRSDVFPTAEMYRHSKVGRNPSVGKLCVNGSVGVCNINRFRFTVWY